LNAGVEIFRIERAQPDGDFRGALAVATGLALLGHLQEELLGVGEGALLRRQVAGLQQRVFVIRLQLEDLLEERDRLWIEALFGEVIGNARVLLEALVDLLGADVEVSERVGAVPVAGLGFDDFDVLGDGGVDLAEFQGLLRRLQRGFTIKRRHWDDSYSMVSNRVAGLNERRCCGE
jgi:hypothetical protein